MIIKIRYYIISMIIFCSCNSSNETASPIFVDNSNRDSISKVTDDQINQIDSIGLIIDQKVNEVKRYQNIKHDYEQQVSAFVYQPERDNREVDELRRRLNEANNEILRLNNEIAGLRNKGSSEVYATASTKKPEYVEDKVPEPDDNSIIIELDTTGIVMPSYLKIYLIPYEKKVKKYMVYETSCNVTGYEATKYNGLYFFNSVEPGKYLIKICTYYGNYKLVRKDEGKMIVKMQVSPPLQ